MYVYLARYLRPSHVCMSGECGVAAVIGDGRGGMRTRPKHSHALQTELCNSYNLVLDAPLEEGWAPQADTFLSPLISPGLCASWC